MTLAGCRWVAERCTREAVCAGGDTAAWVRQYQGHQKSPVTTATVYLNLQGKAAAPIDRVASFDSLRCVWLGLG
jgi:hypothetical protein